MVMPILPQFQSEADSLARIIALAYEPARRLTDPPRKDVVRLIAEALQSAYEASLRAKLQAKIADQDAARGRPLTDRERLANLRRELDRPLTIEECEADMAERGITPPPAPMPFEPQPK